MSLRQYPNPYYWGRQPDDDGFLSRCFVYFRVKDVRSILRSTRSGRESDHFLKVLERAVLLHGFSSDGNSCRNIPPISLATMMLNEC